MVDRDMMANETFTLQSIVQDATEMSSPDQMKTMLGASKDVRTLMLETAAKWAIFSALHISKALGESHASCQ
jgi:hypothetical protein